MDYHKNNCLRLVVGGISNGVFACSDTDVHTVASLLKLYLRELPEPVVPWTQYHDFLSCTNSLDSCASEVCTL